MALKVSLSGAAGRMGRRVGEALFQLAVMSKDLV